MACLSRACSLLVRKEVFSGRAKFGISGDGKELANIALANAMKPGDFVSGYYRDQTIVAALGDLTWTQYFAQLYGHTSIYHDPHTGGRTMNNHHSTRLLDENGLWKDLTLTYNSAAGVSSTAGQIPRAVGLAYASKLYRNNTTLQAFTNFSKNGNEVCFTTIGDASTSEGMFLEAINAAGVLEIPLVFSVWDDGYGISVPTALQTVKGSISVALQGYQQEKGGNGLQIFTVKGWDYEALVDTYQKAANLAREKHTPCLVHVIELTQQTGHSTSGSHERYKTPERLQFEKDFDCNIHLKNYILKNNLATKQELDSIEKQVNIEAKQAQKSAWESYLQSMKQEYNAAMELLNQAQEYSNFGTEIGQLQVALLKKGSELIIKDSVHAIKAALRYMANENNPAKDGMIEWLKRSTQLNNERYSSLLYSRSVYSPLLIQTIAPIIDQNQPKIDGREVIKKGFDILLEKYPEAFIIGEDVGKIGDVNQSLAGLQLKYGENRVTDTGIREMTIVGQGIGAAMRGLRPIIEIQYLDYIYYALATLTDDLACLHYRSAGGQKAPLIIRSRGHRLEGIWHSGSPMAVLVHSLRGIHICVPRNMTQAVGMYNTLLAGDDPALMIECLNGYRVKEAMPINLAETKVALGQPEVLLQGTDITLVTYGAMCRIALEAAETCTQMGVSLEIIDIQTLLPFDRFGIIKLSLQKTNKIIFADEDMPGGATAYMMHEILDVQNGFNLLDTKPICITAKEHRPAYTSDGDYFSKPSADSIIDAVMQMMHGYNPEAFPNYYQKSQ